ncbi:MAG: TRAP transporter substrate-binding protein [Treponema sp.]|nr:TRAP transporter substrate-binding protein [Treponema sp.]
MVKIRKIFNGFAAVLVCCSVIFSMSACSKKNNDAKKSSSSASKKAAVITDYEIKLGFSTNMQDPRAEAAALFKTCVEEGTGGHIRVTLYPEGKLGSDAELITSVIENTVDMTISSAGNYASYVTPAGYSAMPFLFSDFEEAWAFFDSEENQKINKAFESYNMVVLGYFDNGFRCVTTSKNVGPVNKVADMKDLVIRTSQNQIVMETMYSLKTIPKSYPFAELKDALRNGLFSAQENPIPVIYNNKLYEVQTYLAITNHSYDAMPLTIRKELWDSFSEEYQAIIKEAAKLAQNLDRKLVKKQTEDYIDELKKVGMIITYPDLEEFKEATKNVYDVFEPVYGNLF